MSAEAQVEAVSALRAQLWRAGFRPVPVFNHNHPVGSPGKQPLGDKWEVAARQSPPFCVTSPAVPYALNTGILGDGLRPLDLDIDDPDKASRCRAVANTMFGIIPTRGRCDTARVLMLCRAAEGEPVKRTLTGRSHSKEHSCKIEVLGKGQQFVAFGQHPDNGAELEWTPAAPGVLQYDELPVVTEAQIQAFLEACAPIIDAPVPAKPNGHDPDRPAGEPQADLLRIAAALFCIPNSGPADWETWNKTGMAVWRATGGSNAGWEAFNAWSSRNAAYDAKVTRARWDHYATSPPTHIGAGTLFHLAREATREQEAPPGGDADYDPAGRNRRRAVVWPTPIDFLSDPQSDAPELKPGHLPPAINDHVYDVAERLGVDPASVAICDIVSLAGVSSEDWALQSKRNDYSWTENARLWAAILGDPGILKTPIIYGSTRPVEKLDALARARHADAMRTYRQEVKAAKADKSLPDPVHPKLDRYLIENSTTEALSEVLRSDSEARQHAPAGKVLVRQDEMSEFFANLDRYKYGGSGGGDRGAYLRLYNGGRYTYDRVLRGTFAIDNWSACFLGGCQPSPIQAIAKTAVEDGMLQRFMFIVPGPQEPGVDRRPSTAALHRYQNLFPVLAVMQPPQNPDNDYPQIVALHANAHQHREAVMETARIMAMMPDTSPQMKAALAKWPGLFARLCLTYHLITLADDRATSTGEPPPYPMVVPEETARRVAAFMRDIILPHLLRAHRLMFSTVQTGHAEWIAGHILAERYEQITTRDVVRAYRPLKAPEARKELEAVMANLVDIGWLEPIAPTNPVKPVSTWAVNPAVHTLYATRAAHEKARREKARGDIAAAAAVRRAERAADETLH